MSFDLNLIEVAGAVPLSAAEQTYEASDESFQTWSVDMVYGELGEAAFLPILARAGEGRGAPALLDVGSGRGRVAVAAALSGLVSASVGVELVPRLHREGCRLLRALTATPPVRPPAEGGFSGEPSLCSLVCADMFEPVPSSYLQVKDSDGDRPGEPIASPVYTRTLRCGSSAAAFPLDEHQMARLSQGAFDIVLVNGLCFEDDTLYSCLSMLLGARKEDKTDNNHHWHVRSDGGILLLTSIALPEQFLRDGSVKLLWEEECKGTSWGKPVMVRAYQRG
jgi:hypothetical protein